MINWGDLEMAEITKEYLLELLRRMGIREENVAVSSETTSWKAHREAETIADPAVFPLLREIVAGHAGKGKADRELRDDAYFIYGRTLEKAFSAEDCAFLLSRLEAETDKNILASMLDRIKDLWGRSHILLPPELDVSPILRLTRSPQHRVCHSALHALSACPGRESREALAYWLTQEDEKKCQYEMWYAAIAMQSIGEPEDIPLLERFLKSRRPDLKTTARYAIQYIKERADKAHKEVAP